MSRDQASEPHPQATIPEPPTPPEETLVGPAGRFRIYLGAAAGVGKTCAMLDEGWRRRERGRDVVIGFAETYGRPHTIDCLRDLEVVPRVRVTYRGTQFEEMDLDGILSRRPQLALVDELAHTNIPGSGRHGKRWEDVLELLDAGINVISTLNIQHLESLADSIEEMTGATVRERVPDWVVRRADQTELVDSSPEQLRRRMIHGNVYPPERVPAALTHFFSTHNLSILRDLALRYVADETEEVLLEDQHQAGPSSLETGERILVAVALAPGNQHLLRRAARLANRAKATLTAVHVVDEDAPPPRSPQLGELADLTASLGGQWQLVRGQEVASALVGYAQEHSITQLVVGSERDRGWARGHHRIVHQVLREAAAAGLDVHVIAAAEPSAPGGGGVPTER